MYYEVKLKRTCIVSESNAYGVVKENYLVKAVNYTDAEASIAKYMEDRHSGDEYTVQKIAKSKIVNVVRVVPEKDEDAPERFFKVKLSYVESFDGHTKRVRRVVLANADTIEDGTAVVLTAYDPDQSLGCEVEKIEKTSILDVVNTLCEELKS